MLAVGLTATPPPKVVGKASARWAMSNPRCHSENLSRRLGARDAAVGAEPVLWYGFRHIIPHMRCKSKLSPVMLLLARDTCA